MSDPTKMKRPYDSTRRKAQARETQRQIVEAARRLFTSRGYAGSTLDAIAQEAGVSVETIYAVFGNKKAILARLVDVSVVGDDRPAKLLERSGPQAVKREHDQNVQIRMFSEQIAEIMARVAPLFEVINSAAQVEPEIADLRENILHNRLNGMQFFIDALEANGPLRLSPAEAAETVWAVSSAEVYLLLIRQRGWTPAQYTTWLADTLTQVLLR